MTHPVARRSELASAIHPAVRRAAFETLEGRRLLAYTGGTFDLPFENDFSYQRNGVEDADGQNTGFPIVQGNDNADEYQPELIDLDLDAGQLFLTTQGTSLTGTNFNDTNDLVNVLQMPFNASSETGNWVISTRISGPLTDYDTAFEQAGLIFGPSQDNYIKLVFGYDDDSSGQPVVQFIDEQNTGSGTFHTLGSSGVRSVIPPFNEFDPFNSIDLTQARYVDLYLAGNPTTGEIKAQYRVDGGKITTLPTTLTLTGDQKESFFRSQARAGIMALHKNDEGAFTAAFDNFSVRQGEPQPDVPTVVATRPGDGATDVNRDSFIAADVSLPNLGAGVDAATLTESTVKLIRVEDGMEVDATRNTSGGGDVIILQPNQLLDANTEYRIEITSGVKDLSGAGFTPYSATFTTGTAAAEADPNIAFEKVVQSATTGEGWTGLTMGPDGRLYATEITGTIHRFDVADDGTLSNEFVIDTVKDLYDGDDRFLIGLAFDPASTAENPIAWVTHGEYAFENAEPFTGAVSRLSGENLEDGENIIVNLPRSIRDHMTDQPVFGPDGRLYFGQASMSATGEPDTVWGLREETLLSGAILVLDTDQALAQVNETGEPVDVLTVDSGGSYDPFDADAPLKLYATGLRNTYDLVFHSNGKLYGPTNGSAAGGNTPSVGPNYTSNRRIDYDENGPYENMPVDGFDLVLQTQDDYLFQIEEGRYYGHPNPTRSEFVLFGGNPTEGADPQENTQYPVGTMPDRNWVPAAYSFGPNYSANGAIEYQGDAFDGRLKGSLLVTRYSGGDDIFVIGLDDNGNVESTQSGVSGFTNFLDPLDIVEDTTDTAGRNGNLYVAELAGERITLLKPVPAGGEASVNKRRMYFSGPVDATSKIQTLTLRNTGTEKLVLQQGALGITGDDATDFRLVNPLDEPVTLDPGETLDIQVAFEPESGEAGDVREATVYARTSDANAPEVGAKMRALITDGFEGGAEPSLQRVLNLYGFSTLVGDADPATNEIFFDGESDEVDAQRFTVAGDGPVIFQPIGSYGPTTDPASYAGYYEPGSPMNKTELLTIHGDSGQTVDPSYSGAVKFQPGEDPFSLYVTTPSFTDGIGTAREIYGEDAFNLHESNASQRKKIRVFQLKLEDGTVVENSYIVAAEEWTETDDYNDFVAIIRNVTPLADTPQISTENALGAPFDDRLIFSTIPAGAPRNGGLVRDSQNLIIRNTGNAAVTLDSINVTGQFAVNGFTAGTTLNPGQSITLDVDFTATGGAVHTGELTIETDNATVGDVTVDLAGFWQAFSEDGGLGDGSNFEPTLPQILTLLGYQIDIGTTAELDGDGVYEAVGDEVLSEYWQAAGEDRPIEVRQLTAFHNQNALNQLFIYPEGDPSDLELVLRHDNAYGQSVLPQIHGGTGPAAATFTADGVFGFAVENEFSDRSLNNLSSGDVDGHRFRFFPARDREGDLIPDTYLVVMDFFGFNYDYNDNAYLISGIRPADQPEAPTGVNGYAGYVGVINWGLPDGQEADSFRIYRSRGDRDSFTSAFTSVSGNVRTWEDPTRYEGTTWYRITTVNDGEESVFSETAVTV